MRVVVIGGTGHVGTYLVPRLVAEGYEVSCITRNLRTAYHPDPLWAKVNMVMLDRTASEQKGDFAGEIRRLQPDIVIDMICFTEASARMMVEGLKGRISHYLHCGSMWVHGYGVELPVEEDDEKFPLCEYGHQKLAIERYLLHEAARGNFPATVLHPGHIVGEGWAPVNPAGNLNRDVFKKLAHGEELLLPDHGLHTLHHVHADDVAQAFMNSIQSRENALGQAFHVLSPKALTMRGYAEKAASWYGRKANLQFLPWKEWKETVSSEDASITWDHLIHSMNGSIEKAKRLIRYSPRYTSLQAIHESVSKWINL
ncbi:NAD-dependent epimerase/dehydratase family protein [Flavihumibacter fluvii]|uniref:NAD-dependent epimerase/dehydratase family protein n=1 Tax=Flavihumibacter fluvii TaxID=2838157 RepID=UPI001BDDF213|nr:NAD-dependent epimerase/dehydratase family protein [Flavihumibacter fluvii]ULQ54587.1 NAD-dependent epimerase/dehydratase family protein [Flavihumibacter fluvii]